MNARYINLTQFEQDFGSELADAMRDRYPPGSVIYLEKKTVPSIQEMKEINEKIMDGADIDALAAQYGVTSRTIWNWRRKVRDERF